MLGAGNTVVKIDKVPCFSGLHILMERRQRRNYGFDELCERNDFEEEVNGQMFQADGMACSKVLKSEGI